MREELCRIAEHLDTDSVFKFVSVAKTKEKTIKGALKSYAKGCPYEDIIAIMDITVFSGGKCGFILTEDKLYSSFFTGSLSRKIQFISLNDIQDIKYDNSQNRNTTITYLDSHSINFYIPTSYSKYILDLLYYVKMLKSKEHTITDIMEMIRPVQAAPENDPTVLQSSSATEPKQPDIPANISNTSEEDCFDEVPVKSIPVKDAPADNSSADDIISMIPEFSSLEDEWQTYEQEKLALEKEKIAFRKAKIILEKEKQDLENKIQIFEKEKQDFADNIHSFEKEKQLFEKEKSAYQAEKQAFEKEKSAYQAEKQAFENEKASSMNEEETVMDFMDLSLEEIDDFFSQDDIEKEPEKPTEEELQERNKIFIAGLQCYKQKEYQNAVFLLEKAAQMGHEEAPEILVHCYCTGTGVQKDNKKAFEWLKKAAEYGNAEKQFLLATWYLPGGMGTVDLDMAEYWMEKAANQEHKDAKEGLRIIRRNKGIEYYNAGMKKTKQASMTSDMKLISEDITDALPDFEKAAGLGLVEAQSLLASYYLYGTLNFSRMSVSICPGDKDIDEKKGMYWLKKAVEQEDANAVFAYGLYLFCGKFEDSFQILSYTELAGRFSSSNTNEALGYIAKASDLGHPKAYYWLQEAEKNGIPGASTALKRTKKYRGE